MGRIRIERLPVSAGLPAPTPPHPGEAPWPSSTCESPSAPGATASGCCWPARHPPALAAQRRRPAKRLSLLVYGLSLAFCYTASTLYHGLRIPADRLAAFDRLDRIGIFALIAGSYTPLAWGLLRGRWRWGTLATVWSITAVASGQLAIGGPFPPLVKTGL